MVYRWGQKVVHSLKQRGMTATLRLVLLNIYHLLREYSPGRRRALAQERQFDQEFGVDTSGPLGLLDLEVEDEAYQYAFGYQATLPGAFRRLLSKLPIRHQDFIFIDLGSGKGRTLLLASELPFKKIIGVELSPRLHRIAQENIRKYRSTTQQCQEIEAVCLNAAAYPIPAEPAVIYLYNPFKEVVMLRVLENLRLSLQAHPREVFILYCNPVLDDLLDGSGFLSLVEAGEDYSLYRAGLA